MAETVRVTFEGDPRHLFATADKVRAEMNTFAKVKITPEFTNPGASLKTTITKPILDADREIRRIREQTTKDALRNDAILARSAKSLADLQIKEGKRKADELIQQLDKVNAKQGGGGGDAGSSFVSGLSPVAGAALTGGVAGAAAAVALTAINLAKDAISSLASATVDLSISSVKLAADYQTTTNSMVVFTGSARLAQQELTGIQKLSRETAGLRLQDAEQGAVRLRALGFEASVANDLVAGLAKQKLLSGADEGAIQRVILNLTQIQSGSPRLTQDLKEMILALPTLRLNIIDTFGSLEKFKKAVEEDPDAALKKFAVGIKNSAVPVAGLNDALGKLSDAFIETGRDFGKPILDPFTASVKDLTKFIQENRSVVADWGQFVADTIQGASDIVRGGQGIAQRNPTAASLAGAGLFGGLIGGTRSLLTLGTFGLSEAAIGGVKVAANLGRSAREEAERNKPFEQQFPYFSQRMLRSDFTIDFEQTRLSDAEAAAEEDARRRKNEEDRQRERQRQLADLDSINDAERAALENSQKIEDARLKARHARNQTDEIQAIRERSQMQAAALQDQAEQVNSYYTRLKGFSDLSAREAAELDRKRVTDVAKINAQIATIEFETQRQIAEEQKKGLDKVRELQDKYLDTFTKLQGQTTTNPFVKIFADSDKALTELRKNLAGLSPELQNAAASLQQTISARDLFRARLDNRLTSFDLRNQAQQFRSRTLDEEQKVFNRRLERDAQSSNSTNPDVELQRLREARRLGIDYKPNLDLSVPTLREAVRDIVDNTATFEQERLRKRFDEQLRLASSGAQTPEQQALADRAIISLSQGANPSDFTARQRDEAALAREREATRLDAYERQAARERAAHTVLLTQVRDSISGLRTVATTRGTNALEVLVKNESPNATVKQQPKAATPQDVSDRYDADDIFGRSFNGVPY